jgi:hypothetical protein
VLLLVGSLTDLQLNPGSPFPGAAGTGAVAQPGATAGSTSSTPGSLAIVEAILGVLLLFFVVYLPTRLAGLLKLRNVLWLLVGLFVLLIVLSLLPRVLPALSVAPPGETTTAASAPSFKYPVAPLGSPPAGFLWLTIAVLLGGIGLFAFLLSRRAPKPAAAAEAIRGEAEKALQEIGSGSDFQDVIIRSYLQMAELLRAEQNMERQQSMTPHEFEVWLESEGIPAAPIQRLTALFETVRYGNARLGEQDQQMGLECLRQIAQYSRAAGATK